MRSDFLFSFGVYEQEKESFPFFFLSCTFGAFNFSTESCCIAGIVHGDIDWELKNFKIIWKSKLGGSRLT